MKFHSWWPAPAAVLCLAFSNACLMGFVQQAKFGYSVAGERHDPGQVLRLGDDEAEADAGLVLADGVASFHWIVEARHLQLRLENRSGAPLRIDTDRARFVGPDGKQQPAFVSAGKWRVMDVHAVEAGRKTKIFVVPLENVFREEKTDRYWTRHPLITKTDVIAETRREAIVEGRHYVGRWFDLVLPVEADGRTYEYRFRFTVRSVTPKRTLYA